jgi:nucleotide-binding universal stress UspA family protein
MVTIRRILCPVDFSDVSRQALGRAMAVARAYHAEVTVLHVLPLPSAVPALPYGPEGPGPFGFEVMDRPRTLTELARFVGTTHTAGVTVHQEVAEAKVAHREILVQAARTAADLIVLGTHGHSGPNHLFLGSVAEKTLRASPVPVLIVPPTAAELPGRVAEPFTSVLCAVDFSKDSEQALAYAASLAQHDRGRLTVMHVVERLPVGYDAITGGGFDMDRFSATMTAAARQHLDAVAAPIMARMTAVETVLGEGKAYKAILHEASLRGADVIVVGVHGRNALDRLVFGSTAEHLIRRARCPVLAVRTENSGHAVFSPVSQIGAAILPA